MTENMNTQWPPQCSQNFPYILEGSKTAPATTQCLLGGVEGQLLYSIKFLLYNEVNQLYVYIYLLLLGPLSHLSPPPIPLL